MHTFADLAKALNRSTVYVSGLQSRLDLPVIDGVGYSAAYLTFLQTVVHLRTLSITEETLRDLSLAHREEALGPAPCRLHGITHLSALSRQDQRR